MAVAKVEAKAVTKVHNLRFIDRDRGYRFQDRDPAMEELCDLIDKSGLTAHQITQEVSKASHGLYHVGWGTINNWLNGKTRRPSNHTLTWVGYALGYERKWRKTR